MGEFFLQRVHSSSVGDKIVNDSKILTIFKIYGVKSLYNL